MEHEKWLSLSVMEFYQINFGSDLYQICMFFATTENLSIVKESFLKNAVNAN